MNHELLSALRNAVSELVKGEVRVAVAYSGGLDSSLIAALASENTSVRCYTCAVDGSFDYLNARESADDDGREFTLLGLCSDDLRLFVARAAWVLGSIDPTRVAYTIPVLCALHGSAEKVVLTGSGADELFCGYSKYERMEDPSDAMADDLRKMLSESRLLSAEADRLGKTIGFPFVASQVVAVARRIPLGKKTGPGLRKVALREVAEHMCLQSYRRPKKAAQYSSGVMREMERLAKEDGLTLSKWTAATLERSESSPLAVSKALKE